MEESRSVLELREGRFSVEEFGEVGWEKHCLCLGLGSGSNLNLRVNLEYLGWDWDRGYCLQSVLDVVQRDMGSKRDAL